MLTLPQALARLRRDLGDTDPLNETWPDEALERHIDRALSELSRAIPRELKTSLQATPGSRDLSVATLTARTKIVAVEWPVGVYPPEYRRWSLWQDTLTLLVDAPPAAADSINVYWHANHTIDPAGTTLPEWAEELLLTGAAGYAAQEAGTRLTNQVNQGGHDVARMYAAQADAALKTFRSELRRLSPAGSLRTSTLYVPAASIPTQNSDPGPP